MLGLLSEPAVTVHALDRYVHAANAWNQKTLAASSHQGTTATSTGGSAATAEDIANSPKSSGTGSQAASDDNGSKATMPVQAVRQVGGPEAPQSHDEASAGSEPSGKENSSAAASQSSEGDRTLGEESAAVETSSSMRSDLSPRAASPRLRSRVGALLSRLRGRREKAASEQPSPSGGDQKVGTLSAGSLPDSAQTAAGSTEPAQASMSSGTEAPAASTLEAPSAPGIASSAGSGSSGEPGSMSAVTVDWGQLNSSMMQSLHSVISDLVRAAVAKVPSALLACRM